MSTTLTGDSRPYLMSMQSLLLVIAPDQQCFLMDAHELQKEHYTDFDSRPYRVMSTQSLLLVIAPDQQRFLMDAHVQEVAFQIRLDKSFNIYRDSCMHPSRSLHKGPFAGLLSRQNVLQRYASYEAWGCACRVKVLKRHSRLAVTLAPKTTARSMVADDLVGMTVAGLAMGAALVTIWAAQKNTPYGVVYLAIYVAGYILKVPSVLPIQDSALHLCHIPLEHSPYRVSLTSKCLHTSSKGKE